MVLPCLGLSLALEVLLIVFLMSVHLVLVYLALQRSWSHILSRSGIVWPPCLTVLLDRQCRGWGILKVVLRTCRNKLSRVNMCLEISTESVRPSLQIAATGVCNCVVLAMSSIGVSCCSLLVVRKLDQLVWRHALKLWWLRLKRVTLLRLRKVKSRDSSLTIVSNVLRVSGLGLLCRWAWQSCLIGRRVNWPSNQAMAGHLVQQLRQGVQIGMLLLTLIVGVHSGAHHSSALRLSGHHPCRARTLLLGSIAVVLWLWRLVSQNWFGCCCSHSLGLSLDRWRCRSDCCEHCVRIVGGNCYRLLLGAYHMPKHAL